MRDALARLPIPAPLLTTLVLLLGALVAPHAANLSPLVLGFFYTALAWRLLAQRQPRWMPGRWLLLLLMITALVLVVGSTGLYDGRLAGTALLVVMLGLKLLELRARRDMHVTIFLGYFLVLTLFLYNQSLALAAYLLLGVLALVSIQVGLNRVNGDARRQLRQTLAMVAGALPLALVIFVLFPRLQNPLWGINTASAVTGISGEMSLGDIGKLSQSNATAFRVRFFGPPPDPAQRYWRGPVLWDSDGRTWSSGRPAFAAVDLDSPGDAAIDYEVTLEPTGEYWLFGLDIVTGSPPASRLNSNYTLVSDQRVHRRLSYQAQSDPEYRIDSLSPRQRQRGLQLPAEVSQRTRELVEGWRADTDPAQPHQLIDRALAHYAEQPFVYTLSPGRLESADPVDEFLFESRRGFCEHYAGSFALLMRLAGIPSRVVIGYQGGELNPHAEHWVIRQSDAHAWTEVWLPDVGWWRVDPTAAVAPQRIEQPIDTGRSQDSGQILFQLDDRGLFGDAWRNAVWLADAVDLGWHRWVVGFSAERQQNLLDAIGLGRLRTIGLALALLIGGGAAIALVYLVSRWPRGSTRDPLAELWRQFRAKLERAGVRTGIWQGPDSICAAAMRDHPHSADQLVAITRLYVQLRYGRGADRQQLSALRRRIRLLRIKA